VHPANPVNRMSTKHTHVPERKIRLVHRVEPVLRISTFPLDVPGSKIGFVLIAVPVLPPSMNLESVPRSTIGFVQHVAFVARGRDYLKNAQQLRIPFALNPSKIRIMLSWKPKIVLIKANLHA